MNQEELKKVVKNLQQIEWLSGDAKMKSTFALMVSNIVLFAFWVAVPIAGAQPHLGELNTARTF